MANVRHLDVALLDWEARLILKALSAEQQRLLTLAQETEDEDVAADAGNDSIEASLLLERVAEQAKSVFGDQIMVFSEVAR